MPRNRLPPKCDRVMTMVVDRCDGFLSDRRSWKSRPAHHRICLIHTMPDTSPLVQATEFSRRRASANQLDDGVRLLRADHLRISEFGWFKGQGEEGKPQRRFIKREALMGLLLTVIPSKLREKR